MKHKAFAITALLTGCYAILLLLTAPRASASEIQTVSTFQAAVSIVRETMVNRQSFLVLRYTTNEPDGCANRILSEAEEHTGVGNEGDYILCSLNYANAYQETIESGNGGTTLRLSFSFNYMTTAEQEKEASKAFDRAFQSLKLSGKSDAEKVRTILSWIGENIEYDYDPSPGNLKYTPYSGIVSGKTVCNGYAGVFYRLACDAGIDARTVTGKNREGGAHRWCIVKVGGEYYNVNPTAGADERYFLKSDSNAFYSCYTRDEPYNCKEFRRKYPMSSMDYDEKDLSRSASVKLVKTSYYYNGKAQKPSVTVKANGNTLKKGTDYSVSYDNNTEPGSATVTVKGKGTYHGSISKSFTIKLRKPTLTSVKNTSKGITLRWKKVKGAKGYYIYRKKLGASSEKYHKIKTIRKGSTRSYIDKKAKSGTKYRYSIRAYRGKTKSAASRKSVKKK